MAKNLLIVESPSKSKTIEKYLGEDYIVLSSVGHIRDLATSGPGGLGIDVENNYEPTYKESKDKKKVISQLKKASKEASFVYIATDPDREGEAIGWHLMQVLELDVEQSNRIVFNEVTKTAILKAIDTPRKIDIDMVSSQESRRMIDRIIGFKLSKLLQNKIKSKSAGRVQSVALKLIVDREKEILAFVPEEYYTIEAQYEDIVFKLTKIHGEKAEIKSLEEALKILSELNNEFIVYSNEVKSSKRNSKLPFTTSTLTQEASSKLGFGAMKTMRVAQSLYEGIDIGVEHVGLITYMRTDSSRLNDGFIGQTKGYIKDRFGTKYQGFYKGEVGSQDAHEGIRVTDINRAPSNVKQYLNEDEIKLYSLIYARSLACLMAPAVIETNTITLENNGYTFNANAQEVKFDGYLRIYKEYEQVTESKLPNLDSKSIFGLETSHIQHFTKPKGRFTEAKLIKEMEECGIGRPSTYASTMNTIKTRNYVTKESKSFKPTEQGIITIDALDGNFSSIINVDYTKGMEDQLDKISKGEFNKVEIVDTFYNKFIPMVEEANEKMEKIPDKETGEHCPKCDSMLVEKKGRFGDFVACSAYPECKYIKGEENKVEPETTGITCPKCNKGELVKRVAKKGKNKGNEFYACNKFPKCKNIVADIEELKK